MNYSNRQLIRDMWTFIRPYKVRFWLGTFFRSSGDLVWLFTPWAIGEIVTFAANYQSGKDVTYVWYLCGGIALAALYTQITRSLAKYHIYWLAEKIAVDSLLLATKHLFSLDNAWQEQEGSGNKMKRITRGGDSLNKILRMYVNNIIEASINLVAILIIFYSLEWQLTVLLGFFFISYYFIALALTKKAVQQADVVNKEEEKLSGVIFESINNIQTVKALGISQTIVLFLQQIADVFMREVRLRIIYFQSRERSLSLYQELYRVSLLAATAWFVFQGSLPVGIIATVTFYFTRIREAADELAQVYNDFVVGKIAVARMQDILNTPATVELSGDKKFPANWETLRFEKVSFAYKGRNVLQDLSFTIHRGEKIGIVGISGTGKTTLFKLLLKLYNDYEGEILFDTTPLREIHRKSYIAHTAVVPQETELFHFSLKNNITLTQKLSPAMEQERLAKALRVAHVNDFVPKLPQGVETFIGEKGFKLSGGEKQRVGIARAVFKQPDILLLDEATSHLDVESERNIQDALHAFLKNTTAIVIAHRLSTLKQMNRILVMEHGHIVETGSFQELIQKSGIFASLWEKQRI